jgi:anti-sigma factor (TIGR02949 family)
MSARRRSRPGACRELLAELFDYLDGELSAARYRALERHLARCPCCGELAKNLRQAIAICRAEGASSVPASVRARARARIRALLGAMPPAPAPGTPPAGSRVVPLRGPARR